MDETILTFTSNIRTMEQVDEMYQRTEDTTNLLEMQKCVESWESGNRLSRRAQRLVVQDNEKYEKVIANSGEFVPLLTVGGGMVRWYLYHHKFKDDSTRKFFIFRPLHNNDYNCQPYMGEPIHKES